MFLSGCGEVADTSGLSGTYQLVSADALEQRWPVSAGLEQPFLLRLDADGSGIIQAGDENGRISWGIHDGVLQIQAEDVKLTGSLNTDGFSVQFSDESPILRFERVTDASALENHEKTSVLGTIPDSWYGWWKIQNAAGIIPDTWYDCCAELRPVEENTILFVLWDENGSRQTPLAEVRMQVEDDDNLCSLGGYFLYDSIGFGEWIISLKSSELYLGECAHDAGGESFRYTLYLKPWGSVWKDGPSEQRPFYYEEWYLPNRLRPMPDSIPWKSLEEHREMLPSNS